MLLTIIIISLAIVNLVNTLTANLQCRPLEKLWNPAVLGVCWDPNIQLGIGYGQSGMSGLVRLLLNRTNILLQHSQSSPTSSSPCSPS